jgi:hypothetical protein
MLGSVGSLRKLSGGFFCQHYKAIQRVTRAYDQILIPVLRQNLIPTVHTENPIRLLDACTYKISP